MNRNKALSRYLKHFPLYCTSILLGNKRCTGKFFQNVNNSYGLICYVNSINGLTLIEFNVFLLILHDIIFWSRLILQNCDKIELIVTRWCEKQRWIGRLSAHQVLSLLSDQNDKKILKFVRKMNVLNKNSLR